MTNKKLTETTKLTKDQKVLKDRLLDTVIKSKEDLTPSEATAAVLHALIDLGRALSASTNSNIAMQFTGTSDNKLNPEEQIHSALISITAESAEELQAELINRTADICNAGIIQVDENDLPDEFKPKRSPLH